METDINGNSRKAKYCPNVARRTPAAQTDANSRLNATEQEAAQIHARVAVDPALIENAARWLQSSPKGRAAFMELEAFFERCSLDWESIAMVAIITEARAAGLPVPGMSRRDPPAEKGKPLPM